MQKKPSEPLIVGKKRYYKYKIIWEDIVGTPDYVYSFASYFIEEGEIEFGDRNIYPRSVIKKMIRI